MLFVYLNQSAPRNHLERKLNEHGSFKIICTKKVATNMYFVVHSSPLHEPQISTFNLTHRSKVAINNILRSQKLDPGQNLLIVSVTGFFSQMLGALFQLVLAPLPQAPSGAEPCKC